MYIKQVSIIYFNIHREKSKWSTYSIINHLTYQTFMNQRYAQFGYPTVPSINVTWYISCDLFSSPILSEVQQSASCKGGRLIETPYVRKIRQVPSNNSPGGTI